MAFDTSLLDAAIARRRQQNEQQRQVILARLMQWLETFAAEYEMQGIYIFGSLTKPGKFTEQSDVDIAFESMQTAHFCSVISILLTRVNGTRLYCGT